MQRVLVVGWPSFVHGEATAGDVCAMEAVARGLRAHGVTVDLAWSPRFRPGGLAVDEAEPARYDTLVFTCGPLRGEQVEELHRRFARCRRLAVGVSVIDPEDPAVTGFDVVLPRDGSGGPRRDLSATVETGIVPVVGVVLAPGQAEYGERRRHERVRDQLTAWVAGQDCAPVPLDTRLDAKDWRLCATPGQYESIVGRLDLVVTTRLHGLVLALKNGVPALAADPVAGGAKVGAQAAAWDWPVLTCPGADGPEPLPGDALRELWAWCLTSEARAAARDRAAGPSPSLLTDLLNALD